MTTIQTFPALGLPMGTNNPLAAADDDTQLIEFLDQAIPLEDRSHGEIVAYGVHTPFWHSECYAVTNTGEKIRFANKHRFLGWSGRNPIGSLLFKYGEAQLELKLRNDRASSRPVAEINLLHVGSQRRFNQTSYIGITGAPI